MDTIQSGLVISAVGLIITFTALGIFIGVIVLLQKLFPPKAQEEVIEEVQPVAAITEESSDSDEAVVALLAAAAYLRSRRSNQLGSALVTGHGPYRTSRN